MKLVAILAGFFLSLGAMAQRGDRYAEIDAFVANLEAPSPDSLGRLIAGRYQGEHQKARAVFSWIAQHISYNTSIYSRKQLRLRYPDDEDTATVWPPGIEMAARKVLQRRVAVCEGYARLFKTVCNYAGLEAELISGYARANGERSSRFKTNHTWNAVRVDSVWKLVDPTWGSGYVTFSDQFISRIDERYFLPEPQEFIRDHYPEDLRWTLLPQLPEPAEFRYSPFLSSAFVKYSIETLHPQTGIIEAAIGDTLHFELRVRDPEKDRAISPSPFFDSAQLLDTVRSVFLSPAMVGRRVRYQLVVRSANPTSIHLLYNEDIILRYSLRIRRQDLVMERVH